MLDGAASQRSNPGKSTAMNDVVADSEMTRTFHGRRVTLNPSNLDNSKFNTVLGFDLKEQ